MAARRIVIPAPPPTKPSEATSNAKRPDEIVASRPRFEMPPPSLAVSSPSSSPLVEALRARMRELNEERDRLSSLLDWYERA